MALDLCKPGKLETTQYGSFTDTNWTEVSPCAGDAVGVAGVFVQEQGAASEDKTVLVDRTSGNLRLTDQQASHILAELVSSVTGQVGSHDALRDLQHFLGNEGPGTGFATGAVQTVTYVAGSPLVSSQIWWTSSAQTQKILSKTLTYIAGTPLVSTVTWVIYNAAGSALRTLVDTATYSGPLLTSVTRTWS